jgi:uncharacterized protein (DUF885 family)
MPVRSLLEQIQGECQGIIAENPFLAPIKRFPAVISARDRKRLTEEIVQVVNSEVLPAFHQFAGFVARDYAPHGRQHNRGEQLALRRSPISTSYSRANHN